MWNRRTTISIAMLFCLVCVPVCIGQKDKVLSGRELLRAIRKTKVGEPALPASAEKGWPTANELLSKYAENQDKYQSFIVRAVFESTGIVEMPDGSRPDVDNTTTTEYRFDAERFSQRHDIFIHNQRSYTSHLWDGNSWYSNARGGDDPGRLIINRRTNRRRHNSRLSRNKAISAWLGYFYGADERIDTILLEAIKSGRSVSLQDTMQEIGGSDCYAITATTRLGKYTVWLDPNKDHNIVRAIVEKRAGDSYLDKPPLKEGESAYYKLDYIQYKKQGAVWVPQKAKWQLKAIGLQGFVEEVTECNFTEVYLDPNHEALASFIPDDVMNGATVHIRGVPDIRYTWRDGKVVDAQGREVVLAKPKPKAKSQKRKGEK